MFYHLFTKRLQRLIPIAVWVFALLVVAMLYNFRSRGFQIIGIAQSDSRNIIALESGKLISVAAQLYETVSKDQTLALIRSTSPAQYKYQLDMLNAKKQTAIAELDRLKAELRAARNSLSWDDYERQSQQEMTERRLALDIESTNLSVLEIKTEIEPKKLMLMQIETELNALTQLYDRDAIEFYELEKLKAEHDVIEEEISSKTKLLEQAQSNLQLAKQRHEAFLKNKNPDAAIEIILKPLRQAIIVQEKRIGELFLADDEFMVKAPFDGVITSINYTSGQDVISGDILLTISQPEPQYIMAWLDQSQANQITKGAEVEIIKTSQPRGVIKSRVAHLGPVIEPIPQHLLESPNIQKWGRPIIIELDSSFNLLVNEVVGIRKANSYF